MQTYQNDMGRLYRVCLNIGSVSPGTNFEKVILNRSLVHREYLPEHCDPYVDEMGLTDIDTLPGILADTVADLEGGMDIVFAYIEVVDAAGHKYGPGTNVMQDFSGALE